MMIYFLYAILQLAHVVITFKVEKEKLPPLALKNFLFMTDINYFSFSVPSRTFNFKLSSTISVNDCSLDYLFISLQPGSLPVVKPFNVELPQGVIDQTLSYNLELPLFKNLNETIFSTKDNFSIVMANVFKDADAVRVEIEIGSPNPGLWFVGAYLTTSTRKECFVWLISNVVFEIYDHNGHILYDPKYNYSKTNNVVSNTKVPTKLSEVPFVNHHLNEKKYNKRKCAKVLHSDENLLIKNKQVNFMDDDNHYIKDNVTFNKESYFLLSPISLELTPLENRLFSLTVINEITSISIVVDLCKIKMLSPLTNKLKNLVNVSKASSRKNSFNAFEKLGLNHNNEDLNCPISVDANPVSLPLSLYKQIKQSNEPKSVVDDDNNRSDHVKFKDSFDDNLIPKQNSRYIFNLQNLQGMNNEHYLYVHNYHTNAMVNLQLTIIPHFDCNKLDQIKDFYNEDFQSTSQKISHSRYRLFTLISMNKSQIYTDNSGGSIRDQSNLSLSFLPWINSQWPELTPKYGEKEWLKRQSNKIYQIIHSNLGIFQSHHPAYQSLVQCTILPSPTRIQLMSKFAYHFTYQPDFSHYASLLHLKPWHVIIVPININPGPDTGGIFEVALQLNALNASWQSEKSEAKPLSRQVILHGCFAKYVVNTPIGFTDPKRCPLWLRLATNYGVAVSVSHAVSSAISEALASSQPLHRSERLPTFDTSFREDIDRSFFHYPYPSAGRWYLSLYAECYTMSPLFCSSHHSTSIDVSLVLRSTPCVNYRCRSTGEGSTLTPSRVLHSDKFKNNHDNKNIYSSKRWFPPWFLIDKKYSYSNSVYSSPFQFNFTNNHFTESQIKGICVNLNQNSIIASTCSCIIGYGGLGCMNLPIKYFKKIGLNPFNNYPSKDAFILTFSNLAFLPALLLALIRHLWIPAVVYGYTLVFSMLYHLCDTDPIYQPKLMNGLSYNSIYQQTHDIITTSTTTKASDTLITTIRSDYTYKNLINFSNLCVLSVDTLSFCDFFGAIFSIWVTIFTAAALPINYLQYAYIIGILLLTVAVQVVRYSVGLFMFPLIIGLIILGCSWFYYSRKLRCLFPPIQWWIVGLLPGTIFASIGIIIYSSNYMTKNYTKLHSLWHLFIGLSLTGFLPWPKRWRIALSPIIPKHIPLSCGGTIYKMKICKQSNHNLIKKNNIDNINTRNQIKSNPIITNHLNLIDYSNQDLPHHEERISSSSSSSSSSTSTISSSPIYCTNKLISIPFVSKLKSHKFCQYFNNKLDKFIEMNYILDSVCSKWPKLNWILPYGYKSKNIQSEDPEI